MKQPKPLPTEPPFITFYTPTFRRPQRLARNMASIGQQTAVEHIEQIVLPDHVGYGVVGGLYGRMRWYAEACRGRYVHVLADDDCLVDETVVAKVMKFAETRNDPPVIVVNAIKGGLDLPSCDPLGVPGQGEVDLSNYILRRDVWLRHYNDYGDRYEGDFDHAMVLHQAGYERAYLDLTFVEGGASNGRYEPEWEKALAE